MHKPCMRSLRGWQWRRNHHLRYRWGDQGSDKQVSCLGLHTVKPERSPRASKSTATPFPEPEAAPALQIHMSWYCYQNLVLIHCKINITKRIATDLDLSCWQAWVLRLWPKGRQARVGFNSDSASSLGKMTDPLSGRWAPNLQIKGVRLESHRDGQEPFQLWNVQFLALFFLL